MGYRNRGRFGVGRGGGGAARSLERTNLKGEWQAGAVCVDSSSLYRQKQRWFCSSVPLNMW